MKISAYRKTIVSLVGTILTWAGVAYVPDGHLDRGEVYALLLALATSAGVYAVTNGTKTDTTVPDAYYLGQSEALSRPPVLPESDTPPAASMVVSPASEVVNVAPAAPLPVAP